MANQTVTTNAVFIPELWSDEVIATYEKNLVIVPNVKRIPWAGKKGDTFHVPMPGRGSASAKVANTDVTAIVDTATELVISIDQHFEYSRYIEDIANIQSLSSMREFYTSDAGYALSKQVDSAMAALAAGWQGGSAWDASYIASDGATLWDGSANTNAGNGASITDAGLRRAIQRLDDDDVPGERVLIVPPSEKNVLLGIDRFNSTDFSKNQGVATGEFGEVYGIKVLVTTNLATVTADDTSTEYKAALLFHNEALVYVEQMSVRSQSQYKQEKLADLYTGDTIYGKSVYRGDNGVALIVPA